MVFTKEGVYEMRKENVVDLVSEVLYPGLFKEYKGS